MYKNRLRKRMATAEVDEELIRVRNDFRISMGVSESCLEAMESVHYDNFIFDSNLNDLATLKEKRKMFCTDAKITQQKLKAIETAKRRKYKDPHPPHVEERQNGFKPLSSKRRRKEFANARNLATLDTIFPGQPENGQIGFANIPQLGVDASAGSNVIVNMVNQNVQHSNISDAHNEENGQIEFENIQQPGVDSGGSSNDVELLNLIYNSDSDTDDKEALSERDLNAIQTTDRNSSGSSEFLDFNISTPSDSILSALGNTLGGTSAVELFPVTFNSMPIRAAIPAKEKLQHKEGKVYFVQRSDGSLVKITETGNSLL